MALTLVQIDAELAEVRAAILRITGEQTASFTVGGRQVAAEGVNKLQALYDREERLLALREQVEKDGISSKPGAIPVRRVIVR